MKKYLFLSSAFLMTMAGANASDKIITSANTCTVDVLGVSDNNATANTIATWDLKDYECPAGQYLLETETNVECTECPTGSYCPGGTYTVESENMGKTACPTTHPNSTTGAGADTQCYTACTVATANIAHATAVGGNDYFGDGADACYATACDTGYHVDGDVELVEKTPVIPVDYQITIDGYAYIDGDGNDAAENLTDVGLTENNTWVAHSAYGTLYGKASCQPVLNTEMIYALSTLDGSMSIEEFKNKVEPLVGVAKTQYAIDIIMGIQNGTKPSDSIFSMAWFALGNVPNADYSTDSTGQYCYCQLDGFLPTGGDRIDVTSAPWIFSHGTDAKDCPSNCILNCTIRLGGYETYNLEWRAAILDALDIQMLATCAANTINIDWNPDNNGEHIKNMCTYEGSIELPTPDPVKPGYTFTGWKLVE